MIVNEGFARLPTKLQWWHWPGQTAFLYLQYNFHLVQQSNDTELVS